MVQLFAWSRRAEEVEERSAMVARTTGDRCGVAMADGMGPTGGLAMLRSGSGWRRTRWPGLGPAVEWRCSTRARGSNMSCIVCWIRFGTRAHASVQGRAEGVVGLACSPSQTQALTKPS